MEQSIPEGVLEDLGTWIFRFFLVPKKIQSIPEGFGDMPCWCLQVDHNPPGIDWNYLGKKIKKWVRSGNTEIVWKRRQKKTFWVMNQSHFYQKTPKQLESWSIWLSNPPGIDWNYLGFYLLCFSANTTTIIFNSTRKHVSWFFAKFKRLDSQEISYSRKFSIPEKFTFQKS